MRIVVLNHFSVNLV